MLEPDGLCFLLPPLDVEPRLSFSFSLVRRTRTGVAKVSRWNGIMETSRGPEIQDKQSGDDVVCDYRRTVFPKSSV